MIKRTISRQIQIFSNDNGIIKDLNGYSQVAQYKKTEVKILLEGINSCCQQALEGKEEENQQKKKNIDFKIGQMRSSRLSNKNSKNLNEETSNIWDTIR